MQELPEVQKSVSRFLKDWASGSLNFFFFFVNLVLKLENSASWGKLVIFVTHLSVLGDCFLYYRCNFL